jgi:hypothetical protein
LAVKNDSMHVKHNECTPNNFQYVSKVRSDRASTIVAWSCWQLKGCIVTSIHRGVFGLL